MPELIDSQHSKHSEYIDYSSTVFWTRMKITFCSKINSTLVTSSDRAVYYVTHMNAELRNIGCGVMHGGVLKRSIFLIGSML